MEGLGAGAVDRLEGEGGAEGGLGAVHAVDVHEVRAADGAAPKLHAGGDGSAVGLDEHLDLARARRHFVGETGVLSLDLLEGQVFGEGGGVEAQLGRSVGLADVGELALGRLGLVLVDGAVSGGGGEGGEAGVDAVIEDGCGWAMGQLGGGEGLCAHRRQGDCQDRCSDFHSAALLVCSHK